MATHTLALPEVDLVYDVAGPLPPTGGRPPLLLVGQPMTAEGFDALAGHLADRTVVTYDPRGLGRSSVRRDGRVDLTPQDQATDLHALIAALDAGPVDVFASSGGAVTALALVTANPGDVVTLVAVVIELVGVLAIGTLSLLRPADFPEPTVWSEFGIGYGFVPVVLPVLGLLWLRGKS